MYLEKIKPLTNLVRNRGKVLRPMEYIMATSNWLLDRVPKKSKFSEWPAEFIVYSRDKYKNFLLTKFLKIL